MPIWTDYPTQTTPDDADTLLAHDVSETVVGKKMKRTTWANIKAAIKALADTYYLGIASKAADSDKLDGVEGALYARQNAAPVGAQVLTSVAGAPTWAAPDGWTPAPGAWTINTAATGIINVPDSSIFGMGNPVKLYNGSTKYFYVIAVPTGTTIQVSGDTTGLVGAAGTALTVCFYSKMSMPTGFPGRFSFTPAITYAGGSVNPTSANAAGTLIMTGRKVSYTLIYNLVTRGTGDRSYVQLTVPVPPSMGGARVQQPCYSTLVTGAIIVNASNEGAGITIELNSAMNAASGIAHVTYEGWL